VTKNEQIIIHALPQKPKTVEMQKLAQTYVAHDVRMMPELFVFQLCTAFIHKKMAK